MLYHAYETRRGLAAPLLGMAALQADALRSLPEPLSKSRSVRTWRAMSEILSLLTLTHQRPAFGIDSVTIGGSDVSVREARVHSTPFATLVRFAKDAELDQPRVLVLRGLAGHAAQT